MSAAVNASAVTPFAREEIQARVRYYVNTNAATYGQVKNSDTEMVNVRGTYIVGVKTPNGTLSGGSEGFIVGAAGGRVAQRETATYRRFAMATRFSEDALHSTAGMIEQTLSSNRESDGKQIGWQCDAMCFGTGEGYRGTVQVSASGSTPTLTFYIASGGVGLNDMGTSLFIEGGSYEFRSGDGAGTLRAGGPYKCLSMTATTATFDSNINAAVVAGDFICYAGLYNGEYQGYPYHLDNNAARTYQGLNTNTFSPRQFPYVEDQGGTGLTIGAMQRLKQAILTKRGPDELKNKHYWQFPACQAEAFLGIGQALGANNSSIMRGGMPQNKLDPQFQTIEFAGEEIKISEKQPTTDVYYVTPDFLQRYVLMELDLYRRGADADGLLNIPAFGTDSSGNYAMQAEYIHYWMENLGSADMGVAGRLKNCGTAGLNVPALMNGA